ncbi:MAG: NAD-dependent epimerase/dehydratase family protein [Calditrichaeota bacterium]|nr:MAG: NAD-dependent epimerase/dehydratase family protein [Calditrichota bacterium]
MKTLVTGGAGFIGSHIVDALLEKGHDVAIVDSMITGQKDNINPDAKFFQLDIRSEELGDLLKQEKFDAVIHQAAQMDVRKSVEDPRFDADTNIMGTINLLRACAESGVKRFQFASTGGASYGEQSEFPATEEHPQWPDSPYGITKLACERYINYFSQSYGMSYALLRYANVYGPRQNPHGEAGVVAIFCKLLLADKQPIINGDGKQTRDFVYVSDVVQANLRALEHNDNFYLNVGTGIETDINTIFHELNSGIGTQKLEKHAPAKTGEQVRSVLSFAKTKEILGWEPQVDLKTGINETIKFFQNKN